MTLNDKNIENEISSRDNAHVRHARAVRENKVAEQIFIEGVRLAEEAISATLKIQEVFYTQDYVEDARGGNALSSLEKSDVQLFAVSENVMASIADTKTPQGIVLLAERPRTDQAALENALHKNAFPENPLLVILHRVSNPANAGAVLRTAEAAGVSGVITTRNSTNIFSAKALRGAMGSSFRLPLWTGADFDEVLAWCRRHNIRTTCAAMKATRSHTEIDWTQPRALIVGSEGEGLSPEEIAAADEAIAIPMRLPVESLNLAVASAILLYEAARQRDGGGNG